MIDDKSVYKQLVYPGIGVGVLYNFAPAYAQCEKYYYDAAASRMIAF